MSPCIWQDGVLNFLFQEMVFSTSFASFYPVVTRSYAVNGNQCQQGKTFLVFLIIFAQSVDYRPVALHHLGACQKCRILGPHLSPTESKAVFLIRNQVVPILWMSHSKESEAPSVTLRGHCHPPEWLQEGSLHNLHDMGHLQDGARTLGGEKETSREKNVKGLPGVHRG